MQQNDHSISLQTSTLDRDIQLLNLSSNLIEQIEAQEFYERKFSNLQKLFLASNQIEHIDPSAFHKLIGLIELDLSQNFLHSLEPQRAAFKRRRQDENQVVSDNQEDDEEAQRGYHEEPGARRGKNKETFLRHLSKLRHLNLNSNRLRRINEFTFSPLPQLRQLYLSK